MRPASTQHSFRVRDCCIRFRFVAVLLNPPRRQHISPHPPPTHTHTILRTHEHTNTHTHTHTHRHPPTHTHTHTHTRIPREPAGRHILPTTTHTTHPLLPTTTHPLLPTTTHSSESSFSAARRSRGVVTEVATHDSAVLLSDSLAPACVRCVSVRACTRACECVSMT